MSLPSTATTSASTGPVNRHAPTAIERQRNQLERLLKDPTKAVPIPAPPKEKSIRPPREMMKNVQGSSAGAGSGEFHVYKASRRREYERLKLLEETSQKEAEDAEFERKRREAEIIYETKTAKNRAKRQKKKERSKPKREDSSEAPGKEASRKSLDAPIKKRRLVHGKELVFKRPGEGSGEEDGLGPVDPEEANEGSRRSESPLPDANQPRVVDEPRIVIHED